MGKKGHKQGNLNRATIAALEGASARLQAKFREAHPLKGMSIEHHKVLVASGVFWEIYPEATGNYLDDCVKGL